MAVSQRLRYEILRRDNHACRYCGATAPDVKLNVDHVIPTSLGGSDKPDNLVTACADCNGGKTSSMPNAMTVEDVDQDAFRQAVTRKQETQRRHEALAMHLFLVWVWAYEQTGRTPTEQGQTYFVEETLKVLACGFSARVDLTEPAYRAGLHNALDIQSYIKLPDAPVSPEDARFVNNVDAISAWETEWDFVTLAGAPTAKQTEMFIDVVGAALDAGHARDHVISAARHAGSEMSLNLDHYLPQMNAQGGAN
ncbi:HNH endonuclease [Streptomyces cacaoi]